MLHKNVGSIISTGRTDALPTCLDYFSHSSQTQENHRAITTFKIMCHYESLQKWLGISSIATLTLIIWQMLAYNMSMQLDGKTLKCIYMCCRVMYLPAADFIFFLCYLPTSELFDPPTQLSQCSSGPLSTSLQGAHQRPPCLISYICHTFANKERQQDVTMYSNFFAQSKAGWMILEVV